MLELLHFYNPWWAQGEVPVELAPPYIRPAIDFINKYMELDRVLILKGPRRTGKSTLLYQWIQQMIRGGVDPKHIVYMAYDEVSSRSPIKDLFKAYEDVLGLPQSKWPRIYLILDEVQYLDDWSGQIKRYFDRKLPIQFICSGSSATLIHKGAESLAGRTVEEVLLPFDFFEYVNASAHDQEMCSRIAEFRKNARLGEFPNQAVFLPVSSHLRILFEEYCRKGGFPHILTVKEPLLWKKLLQDDVIHKVIYRDLVELFEVKKPQTLERLFLYLAHHSSELLNISNISNSLKLSREYTEKYLSYLKQAYLVYTLSKYSSSVETEIRGAEKAHVIDPGLVSLFGEPDAGKLMESAIARHLWIYESSYYRNRYECDFVVDYNGTTIPIEVKSGQKLSKRDMKQIRHCMEYHGFRKGIIITRDHAEVFKDRVGEIYAVPAWQFCLYASK